MLKFSTRKAARSFAAKSGHKIVDLGADRTPGIGPKWLRRAVKVV